MSREFLGSFRKLLVGHPTINGVDHIIDCDADPRPLHLWGVKEHQKDGQLKWDCSRLRLYLSDPQKKDDWIDGATLRNELGTQHVLNANVLDYLLDNPDLIPEDWKGKNIFFWGTIYHYFDGEFSVRCLYWAVHRWRWNIRLLLSAFTRDSPAATLAR